MRLKPIAVQLIFLLTLSMAVMFLDHFYKGRNIVKQYVSVIAEPVYTLIAFPEQASMLMGQWFNDRTALTDSINQLELENSLLKVKLAQLQVDTAYQEEFASTVDASRKVADRIMQANIIKVTLDHSAHKLVIDKGQGDSVYLGQPVIDQLGILGQVTELALGHSVVTLITDPSQSTPVLVKRNRLRTLAYGYGNREFLAIRQIGAESDIRAGDILVSSGIGGRYPAGYPVATIDKVVRDKNESFLQISARPAAQLASGEHVLLIWPRNTQQSPGPHPDPLDEMLSMASINGR